MVVIIMGMIPYLPEGTPDASVPAFYKQILDNLEMRCSHHETWHTHKKDPSVCWVCDLLELTKISVREMEALISKSALDIMNEDLSSSNLAEESVQESMIESLNYDEECSKE